MKDKKIRITPVLRCREPLKFDLYCPSPLKKKTSFIELHRFLNQGWTLDLSITLEYKKIMSLEDWECLILNKCIVAKERKSNSLHSSIYNVIRSGGYSKYFKIMGCYNSLD